MQARMDRRRWLQTTTALSAGAFCGGAAAGGQFTGKIKKAVKFAYMDFSTLEKRRRVCARDARTLSAPALPGQLTLG